MKISSKNKGGDCYEAALKYLLKNSKNNLLLVHGEVTGQGAIKGIKYGHAWIENGENVIDVSNGRDIKLPKIIYYALGHIKDKSDKLFKYDLKSANKMILRYRTYGPWELDTEL